MEKHSAYCAMVRLGFEIPETVLVPYKNPVDHVKWAYTAETYNLAFDLDEVASGVGYPMFMKPFDGGAWRGVSRVDDRGDLHRAYDESGQMLMHLQAAADYDSFARSLTIGPETKIMRFRPELPMHDRYEVSHDFLAERAGMETLALSRTSTRSSAGSSTPARCWSPAPGPADRLRQRLPGHRDHLAALLLPVGDHPAGVLVGVLRGHRPQAAGGLQHPVLVRRRRRPVAGRTTTSWALRAGRPVLRGGELLGVVREPALASRRSSRLDQLAPTSTRCCWTPSRRPIRRTSRSGSSRTSAGWSGLWAGDQPGVTR